METAEDLSAAPCGRVSHHWKTDIGIYTLVHTLVYTHHCVRLSVCLSVCASPHLVADSCCLQQESATTTTDARLDCNLRPRIAIPIECLVCGHSGSTGEYVNLKDAVILIDSPYISISSTVRTVCSQNH